MREAFDLILGAVAEPAMHGLLHFLWQGSAVALLLVGVLVLARPRRAETRYRLACGALVLMVILPVATALEHGLDNHARLVLGDPTDGGEAPHLDTTAAVRELARALPVEDTTSGLAGSLLQSVTARVEPADAAPWVLGTWLAGVGILSVLHLGGWFRVRRLTRLDVTPAPSEWQDRADHLRRTLGLDRAVRVLSSTAVQVPAAVGWLRPVILIPAAALSGMPVQQLECILAHELAHIHRRDYLVNLLQTCAETLLFYHPAVWWVSRLIRAERENCCDDTAVQLSGSRLLYARALVEFEELRQVTPRLAVGADGGSLLRRVERLIGGPEMSLHTHRNHLAGIAAALLVVLGGSMLALAAQSQVDDVVALATGATLADVSVKGRWYAERDGDELRLELSRRDRGDKRRGSWQNTIRVDEDDFDGLRFAEDAEFRLVRPAGTFAFAGDFEGDEGDGRFTFAADTDYLAELDELGTDDLSDTEVMVLASQNLEIATVRELRDLGYGPFDDDEIVTIAIFEVTPKYIRDMEKAGFENIPLDKLVAMRVHDVSRDYVQDMHEIGFVAVDVDDAISWSVHGVDVDDVRDLREEFGEDLTAEDVLSLKIHGVDHHYAQEMQQAGFHDLHHEQLLSMKIHGVHGDDVADLREEFDEDLTAEDVLSMKIHGVDADRVHALHEAGHENLDADEVLAWSIHNVSPAFIESTKDLGYDLDGEELLAWKIHGINRSYIESLAELGYANIDSDDLLAMKIHGVTPKWIRHLRDRGIDDLTAEELVRLKISGVDL
ncbi:MAG: M56 family metallopeptidase [bacterium]|nr:M56 family metallopeptidase [bacterium]